MIEKAISRAFDKARSKKWNKTYWLVDVHETIINPNYNVDKIPTDFYPEAKGVLQLLSSRPDIVLILYTCSWPQEVEEYKSYFKTHGIHFDYKMKNPEVETVPGKYGYYIDKPHADVVLDDKAGFDWQTDWTIVRNAVEAQPILCDNHHKESSKLFDTDQAAAWFKSQITTRYGPLNGVQYGIITNV